MQVLEKQQVTNNSFRTQLNNPDEAIALSSRMLPKLLVQNVYSLGHSQITIGCLTEKIILTLMNQIIKPDITSMYDPLLKARTSTFFDRRLLVENLILRDLQKDNFVLKMPPNKEYSVKVRITEINKPDPSP